jgi:hypothetical protein
VTGHGSVEFETLTGQDARPIIAKKLIEMGFDLLEMRQVGASLEEVFLQLTRDQPPPPQVDGSLLEFDENSALGVNEW